MKDTIFNIEHLLFETKLRRMKQYLFETSGADQTEIITTKNNSIVLLPQFTKAHIGAHGKPGTGSVFAGGDFIDVIMNSVENLNITPSTRIYQIKVPGVGYDLVKSFDEASQLPNAEQVEVTKKEGPNDVVVPGFKTSAPLSQFKTDVLSIVVPTANPQFLPDDVKSNDDIQAALNEKRLYVVVSAWPGGEVPRASEWNNKFAIIIPDQQTESKNEAKLNSDNILIERWQKMAGLL